MLVSRLAVSRWSSSRVVLATADIKPGPAVHHRPINYRARAAVDGGDKAIHSPTHWLWLRCSGCLIMQIRRLKWNRPCRNIISFDTMLLRKYSWARLLLLLALFGFVPGVVIFLAASTRLKTAMKTLAVSSALSLLSILRLEHHLRARFYRNGTILWTMHI